MTADYEMLFYAIYLIWICQTVGELFELKRTRGNQDDISNSNAYFFLSF